MTYRQTRDVLKEVSGYHTQLSRLYSNMYRHAKQERSKMIFEYMSSYEKTRVKHLSKIERKYDEMALNTWHQFSPSMEPGACFEKVKLRADMTEDEIINIAMCTKDKLTDFYKNMTDKTTASKSNDLFKELYKVENNEKRRLKITYLEFSRC